MKFKTFGYHQLNLKIYAFISSECRLQNHLCKPQVNSIEPPSNLFNSTRAIIVENRNRNHNKHHIIKSHLHAIKGNGLLWTNQNNIIAFRKWFHNNPSFLEATQTKQKQ